MLFARGRFSVIEDHKKISLKMVFPAKKLILSNEENELDPKAAKNLLFPSPGEKIDTETRTSIF